MKVGLVNGYHVMNRGARTNTCVNYPKMAGKMNCLLKQIKLVCIPHKFRNHKFERDGKWKQK